MADDNIYENHLFISTSLDPSDQEELNYFLESVSTDTSLLSFEAILSPPDEFKDLDKLDWCIANWGTIEDCTDVVIIDRTDSAVYYKFNTVAPPLLFVQNMSILCPEFDFFLKYKKGDE